MKLTSTSPKPFVFVLMPFDEDFDDIYHLGIKQACKDAGAYCERVDEQIFQESILERIFNQISKADIIISDMTNRNPNVFYETGYAHALGKRVILLTHDAQDIPFDLKHYAHIVYSGKILELLEDLRKRIEWFLAHPDKPSNIGYDLQYFIKGVPLIDSETSVALTYAHSSKRLMVNELVVKIDIHNPSNSILNKSLNHGLIVPYFINENLSDMEIIDLPDKRYMHLIGGTTSLLPKEWKSIKVRLSSGRVIEQGEFEFVLVVFTELGEKQYPFKVNIVNPYNFVK